MAIRIAAWNIEGRLHGYAKSGRGSIDHIIEGIKKLDADVIVLPEFYLTNITQETTDHLTSLGYRVIETKCDDLDRDVTTGKWGPVHIGVLSRLPVKHVDIIRPGNVRNLIVCVVTDPETNKDVRIIATHLDDRSETLRLRQVRDLTPLINAYDMPTVMLGDFNAMWHEGRGRMLGSRIVRRIAKGIAVKDIRDVAMRATDMATGTTLKRLTTETNLIDVDARHRPTTTPKMRDILFMPSIRLIQIDHMLISLDFSVTHFTIGKDSGSDHRSISATLHLKK